MVNLYSPAPAALLLSKPNCSLELDGFSEEDARGKLSILMVELNKKGISESFTNITDKRKEIVTLNNGNTITIRWNKEIVIS